MDNYFIKFYYVQMGCIVSDTQFWELSSLANNAKISTFQYFQEIPYFHNKPILFLNFSTHLNFYL